MLVVGTTSNYECLELFDIDKAFGLKVRVPLLDRHECHKILEHDIKIEDIPIKLLTEFKESVRGIPK